MGARFEVPPELRFTCTRCVDCSFSCRSIAAGTGAPLRERFPEWAALLGEGAPAAGSHQLTRARPISGELLWELEHHLLGLLADRTLTLFDRVRCCLQLIRL